MSDKVYFIQKYITNLTVTPEDAVLQAAKQLTAALKRNLKKYMDENEIDQLNKLDTIFNTTANEFQKREKKS